MLDFERKWPEYAEVETANGVAHLVKAGAELQLSIHAGDGMFGSLERVYVEDVDERYETFRARGLDTTQRPESPVHTAPVEQTWGLREFSVTDPDGNGLCFCAPTKRERSQTLNTHIAATLDEAKPSPLKVAIVGAEPQLYVADVERSCEFFCKKLGFSMTFSYGSPPWYAQVGRDSVRLNLRWVQRPVMDVALRDQEELLSTSMTVASDGEIKMLFIEFVSAGAAFHQTLKKQPWGASNFVLRDPDGNLLLFAGPAS